ncbi:MAG: hypothetical protein OEP52_11345 [Acidimicrobiia bacterium]|nr:hypothetical protein [Acidimicrobiia bacterium]
MVGLWAAATAVDQMRKRSKGSGKELIATKKLKPGESYVIRMPGKEEGSLAGSVSPGTVVAEIETNREQSIPAQLLSVATELIGTATEKPAEPRRTRPRRTTSVVTAEEAADGPARRRPRRAAREAKQAAQPVEKLSRRRRRQASRAQAEEPGPAEESFASSLVDVAASFMASDDGPVEEVPAGLSRRRRRRTERLATLERVELDRDALPRRRRRKLDRSERRAQRRPSRRRVRKARRRQRGAARTNARMERRSQPSRRKRRKIRAAERNLEYHRAKVENRSTRRRRRRLRKAEKAFQRLS